LRLAGTLLVLIGLLGALYGLIVLAHDRVVFQPQVGRWLGLDKLGIDGEEVWLDTEDGVRLHAFWVRAPQQTRRAILFLHGNAGNASHRLPNAQQMAALGADVLLLDYRGYGLSEGSPTEAGVYADARAGLAHLTGPRDLPEERIVLFGRSLGGAVAIDLARDRGLAGVILESTFASLSELADQILPLPLGFVVRGRWSSRDKIGSVSAPLLFFHGGEDRVVPIELGRALYDAAPGPKDFHLIPRAGHNTTVEMGGRAYFERIGSFLEQVAPSS